MGTLGLEKKLIYFASVKAEKFSHDKKTLFFKALLFKTRLKRATYQFGQMYNGTFLFQNHLFNLKDVSH